MTFVVQRGCAAQQGGASPCSREGPTRPVPPGRGLCSPYGRGRGETRFPHTPRRGRMFTLAVRAAEPHNAAMNIRSFLGGLRPPKPSQGAGPGCAGLRPASAEVWGNPVSPHPSPRAYVHVSRPCGSAAHEQDEHRFFLGGLRPPKPSQGAGPGCAGLRPASAEVWGNPVSPHPSPRAYVHVSRPCGSAAHEQDEHRFFLGGLRPPTPSHRVGGWGNRVSPSPSPRAYVHVRIYVNPYMRNTPNLVSWAGALPAAARPRARALRVSVGTRMPSSHRRAVE